MRDLLTKKMRMYSVSRWSQTWVGLTQICEVAPYCLNIAVAHQPLELRSDETPCSRISSIEFYSLTCRSGGVRHDADVLDGVEVVAVGAVQFPVVHQCQLQRIKGSDLMIFFSKKGTVSSFIQLLTLDA